MPDTYTSILTTGGWSTNTVTPAYDLVFRKALNAKPTCRQFVDVQPENVSHTGATQRIQLEQYFTDAQVAAAKTPLNEEQDVSATQVPATNYVDLTPNEYGFATLTTLKLTKRGMVPIKPAIAEKVADHCAKVVDELIQDQMVLGTQVLRGAAGRTATNLVTASDTLTSTMLRRAVVKLRANQAVPRDGIFYTGVFHPNAIYDLRSETGAGGWRNPQEYGSDQGRLWVGEVGAYEGVRFVENVRTRNANDGASSAQVYRGYILGKEALAQSIVTEPHVVMGPQTDKLYRFQPLGWYGDLAFKIFRDQAIYRLETGSQA